MISRRSALLVFGCTLAATTGCRALLGSFDECTQDADCAPRGPHLSCVSRLCVTSAVPPLDARCTVLGSTSSDAIRLGSIMARTLTDGGVNLTGVAREQALLLALEQLNPPVRQGIRGRPLQLLACDSTSRAAAAAELASNLIAQGAVTVFTSSSSETIAVSSVTIPAGVLQMSVSASAPEITDLPDTPPGDSTGLGLLWRTAAPDTFQGRVIAQYLVDAGTPKTAVVQLNDTYGQGLEQAFSRDYPPASQSAFLYTRGGDLTAALDGAQAFAPDQLLVIAFADDAARIMTGLQTRPALVGKPLFFTDAAKAPALLKNTDIEGAMGTAPAQAPASSEARQYFVTQYQQRFSLDPLSVSATANAFDAMMCVALACWQANGDFSGQRLAQGLTRLHSGLPVALIPTAFNTATKELEAGRPVDVDGASGPLTFDDRTGEAPGPVEVWRVTGGAFTTVQVVVP